MAARSHRSLPKTRPPLTIYGRMSTIISHRGSNVFHGKTGTTKGESAAGHSGHAHLAHVAVRAGSRSLHRQAHSADHKRLSPDAARIAVSGIASARAKRVGHFQVGDGPRPQ